MAQPPGPGIHVRAPRLLAAIAPCVAWILTTDGVHADVCSPSYQQWSRITGSLAPASAPVHDTAFSPGRSRAYFAQGTGLFTVYNQNFPLGCTPGSGDPCAPVGGTCTKVKGCMPAPWSTPTASSIQNFPSVVPPSTPPLHGMATHLLFLGADDGRLYRIDVSGDPPYPSAASVDTRRSTCKTVPGDRVIATPAVQLYASSNSSFRTEVDSHAGHEGDDVVFVITSDGCGDQTRNRIIAYWASDLTEKWKFNVAEGVDTGPLRVGAGFEGCSIDYESNRLFCGTDAPSSSDQDSLWALDTISGRLLWSDSPGGAVLNRPILHPSSGRLYVVSRPGSLWAYDPAGNGQGGPSTLWTTGLSVASAGSVVTSSPWVESQPGTWQDKILVLDSGGTLRAVQDNGTGGSILWSITPTDSARWVGAPVVLPGPTVSKAFIGRDDGFLQMIQLDGGRAEGVIAIAPFGPDVHNPSLDTDPAGGHAVVVVSGDRAARISVPICTDDPGPAASACFDGCFLPGQADGYPTPNWDPFCVSPDTSCRSYSCRDPGWNPQYNPCEALAAPDSACVGADCDFGGFACESQGDVPDGASCDDRYPGAPGGLAQTGAGTCRADGVPPLAACTLPEGEDCNPATGLSAPGSRHKCVTKPSVCGSVGGGKCCVCNDGYGTHCNDRCVAGQCVSDVYSGCSGGYDAPCINAGDRACDTGTTCCGSQQGTACATDLDCTAAPQGTCLDVDPLDGDPMKRCYYQRCVDLYGNPQHCGACDTDCGEYTIDPASCAADLDCGSCTADAECAAFGGKCVDGACGKCRYDPDTTSIPYPCETPCTNDWECGTGACANGFCSCAAGSECVAGACLPLVCHRLRNRGTCTAGVCTVGAPCAGPNAADVAAASLPGMSSLDFEFTTEQEGSSLCRGYATTYRTDGGAPLARIDEFGAITAYTASPPDATRLNGVAVSRDGEDVFASMVDAGIPGLAVAESGAATYARVKGAVATGGLDDNPFDQVEFNTGPVGPAFDYVTPWNDETRTVWYGNFKCPAAPLDGPCTCTEFDLCRLFALSVAMPEPYCNRPCAWRCEYSVPCPPPMPERITAIAFERRLHGPTGAFHRYLIIGHGTTLSMLDLDGGEPRQRDINLASSAVRVSQYTRGESTVEAILSLAPVPYGDIIVEVRGAGDQPGPGSIRNTWLLNVNEHDLSVRHELDVQRALKHVNPCGAPCANDDQCGGTDACTNGFCCDPARECVEQVCMKACGSCPPGFTCGGGFCRIDGEVPSNFGIGGGVDGPNGRLAVMPSGKLLRWVAGADAAPGSVTQYETTRTGQPGCNDGNLCTIDSYNSVTEQCEYAAVGCDDADLCTNDTCDPLMAQCLHAPVSCDDALACTADSCDPGTGACLHDPVVLAEPGSLQLVSSTSIQWSPTPDATHWNVYRGTIPPTGLGGPRLAGVYDHVCRESADALGDGATQSTDLANPPAGNLYYYLVSAEADGCESVPGRASSGAPIPNPAPCPTPP